MSSKSWLQNLRSALASSRRPRRRRASLRAATRRTNLEVLEDRAVPAFLAPVNYAAGTFPQAVVTADFNRDHILDIAVANLGGSSVSVLLGKGNGTFRPARSFITGASPLSLAVGDFDADGKLDIVTANLGDVSVLAGNGDGTFGAPASIAPGSSSRSVAVGDFNGDGKLDLGVTSSLFVIDGYSYGYYGKIPDFHYEGQANVLLGNGHGTFGAAKSTDLGVGFHQSAVAVDLNGDGLSDFASVNQNGTVSVALGGPSGYLVGARDFFAGRVPWEVTAGDLNGDAKPDLVTANFDGGDVSVLLGDGLGGFGDVHNYAASTIPSSVVLGDFTGDGKLDLITCNNYGSSTSDVSVLQGRGDGTFMPPAKFATGSAPYDLATGDFNGDGWLDAATGNYYTSSSVSVLINNQSWPPSGIPSIRISDPTVTEGNIGTVNASFTLTLSAASAVDVTVHYATADITATAGSDYTAASGDVVIPAGQTSRTFTVAILGDRLSEPTETFAVNLSAPTNATIADAEANCTILDNEPRISISDVTKKEGKKNQTTEFTFIITLSAAYDQPVTMSFQTSDGTATTSDSDYLAKTGTLTFNPGETSKAITIVVNGDSKKEANETFYLDLFGNSSNSLFTKNRGIGTILNDD